MILVTGAARSGTSLTTQVLAACGADAGAVNNLYEHGGVRERLLKPYLASIGMDPAGQHPLPEPDDIKPAPDWRARVMNKLGPGVNCYKDAKIALTWPLWVEHFPDAKWVICRRRVDDIAASCLRTSFMRAHKTQDAWKRWAEHYERGLEGIKASGAAYIEVWPHEAVHGDLSAYKAAVEFCGLSWRPAAVRAVIKPGKWHA